MNWSIWFDSLLPVWLVGAFAVVGLLLLGLGLFRRVRGTPVRLAALAALAFALLNPAILREDREPLSTVVAMVVDESPSQTLDKRAETTAAARAELTERLATFRNVELRVVEAGGPAGGVRSDGTELFGALRTTLADVPPDRLGAILMLTDGQVHDAPAGSPEFVAGAPLHTLLSGHDGEFDRRVVIDAAPRFGIVGERQTITYRVLDEGPVNSAGQVAVTVTRDGEPLARELVTPGEPSRLDVDIAHGGANILEFEAEPLAGELTAINNRAVAEITGVRENLRVLLVSGEPHAGERTWRNLLKSDASVDLVHFTILRPPEKQDGTPINELSLIAFPTRELFSEKIDQFDLIIFDRYARRGVLPILYFDNITRYVRAGGALLVASGPDYAGDSSLFYTPLADVLPAEPTGEIIREPYHARISTTGERHPLTRGLQGADTDPPRWSRWFRVVGISRPSGDIVMDGPDDRPLLILNREGEGRVAMLLSDDAWLWARGYEGGGPHVDLLRRLAHWLMKEPDLEEEALRAAASGTDLTIERQTMADTVGEVTVRAPSGATRNVTLNETAPGLWRTRITADELGLWRVEQGDRRAFASVGPANPREFTDVRSTAERLLPAAEATGGAVVRMADASGTLDLPRLVPVRSGGNYAGNGWLGIRMSEASVLKGVDRIPLFAGFLGLALILGALAATWYREGR
jgi:hypothetical protein